MDFHVWAKLDSDGRIQSVQSSCTQSPQGGHSPVWPSHVADERAGGTIKANNDNADRLVPYVEKKELVYKLDHKVDEMSLIMTQLAEQTKRVKVQEKLIEQYEEKLAYKDKLLRELVNENARLKAEKQWIRRNKSVGTFSENSLTTHRFFEPSNVDIRMVCSLEKSGRSSSWPCDRQFHPGHVDDINAGRTCAAEDADENVTLDDVDGPNLTVPRKNSLKGNVRPSSLKLGFDICGNFPGTDVGVEGHFNIHHEESFRDGYSYARHQDQGFLSQAKDSDKKTEDPPQSESKMKQDYDIEQKTSSDKPVRHVASDGYLDMTLRSGALRTDDSVYSLGKDIEEDIFEEKENRQLQDGQKEYVANEAIHSTWKDVQSGNIITVEGEKDTATKIHLLPDGYVEPKGCHNEYMDVDSAREVGHLVHDKPPLPIRRGRSNSRESTDSSELERQSSSSSSSSAHSDMISPMHDEYYRRTSLPVSSSGDGVQNRLARSRLVQSCEHPEDRKHSLQSQLGDRSQTLEIRKDDHLNKVLKDMRTTMEWNKAKKKLISKSHANTVDNVEHRLRSTVQEVYDAYCILHAEKGRLRKYSKEKVMEKIKAKICRSPSDLKASEEFMRKCLDLVMSASPY